MSTRPSGSRGCRGGLRPRGPRGTRRAGGRPASRRCGVTPGCRLAVPEVDRAADLSGRTPRHGTSPRRRGGSHRSGRPTRAPARRRLPRAAPRAGVRRAGAGPRASAPPVPRRRGRGGRPGRRTARTPGASARRSPRSTTPPARRRSPAASSDRSSRCQGGSSGRHRPPARPHAGRRDPVRVPGGARQRVRARPPTSRARRTVSMPSRSATPTVSSATERWSDAAVSERPYPGRLTATRRTPTRRGRVVAGTRGEPGVRAAVEEEDRRPGRGAALPEVGAAAVGEQDDVAPPGSVMRIGCGTGGSCRRSSRSRSFPRAIWVMPVGSPPASHQRSWMGHHSGAARAPDPEHAAGHQDQGEVTDMVIRGGRLDSLGGGLERLLLDRLDRRSAQSYCWDSSARPAKTMSRPGPGRTSAAMPPMTSSQPTVSSTRRLAAPLSRLMAALSQAEPSPSRARHVTVGRHPRRVAVRSPGVLTIDPSAPQRGIRRR